MGIVCGYSMAISGVANLANMEAWKADPLGNLLKSAADIATGITIILGSIVALATAIIAIMWALAIVTFGALGPAAAVVTPICTTIISTVFPWSLVAAKWALALQALTFIKNLADAATAKTAGDLQTNSEQMTEDAKQGGAMAATIVVAKGMEVGGKRSPTRRSASGSPRGSRASASGRTSTRSRAVWCRLRQRRDPVQLHPSRPPRSNGTRETAPVETAPAETGPPRRHPSRPPRSRRHPPRPPPPRPPPPRPPPPRPPRAETAPAETAPAETAPAETAPAEAAPVEEPMSDWAEEFEQPSQWEATEGEVAAQETAIEEGAPAEGEPGFQENPLDLPENQVSMESAEAARDSLPEPRGGKTTARVEGGEIFESGWADSPGFEGKPATTEQVLSEGVEAGVEHDPHVFDPKNVEGGYESSHAERQAAINCPDEPIGVSRDMCAGCQRWFQARAMSRGVPQFVADPSGGRVFMPDGRIIPR